MLVTHVELWELAHQLVEASAKDRDKMFMHAAEAFRHNETLCLTLIEMTNILFAVRQQPVN